jgi:hypothetical protein
LVDSAIILPFPDSFVNDKSTIRRYIAQSLAISTKWLAKGDSVCYNTDTDTKEGAEAL